MMKIIVPIPSSGMQDEKPVKPAAKRLLAQLAERKEATVLFAIEGSVSSTPLPDLTEHEGMARIIPCLPPQTSNDNFPAPRGGVEAIQAMLGMDVLDGDDLCIILNPEADLGENALESALELFRKHNDHPVVSASEERDHVAQLETCYHLITADIISTIEKSHFKETGLRATLPLPFTWGEFSISWPEHSGIFTEPGKGESMRLSEVQADEAAAYASDRKVWNWTGTNLAQRLLTPEELEAGDTSLSFSSLHKRTTESDALFLDGFPRNRELYLSCDCGDEELLLLAWALDEKGKPDTSTIVIPISPTPLRTDVAGREFRKYKGNFDQLSGIERFAYMVIRSVNHGSFGDYTFRVPLFFETPLVSFDPMALSRRNEASGEDITGRQQLPTIYTADKRLAVLYARQACAEGMENVHVLDLGQELSPCPPATGVPPRGGPPSSHEDLNRGIQWLRDAIDSGATADQTPRIRRQYEYLRSETLLEMNVWKALNQNKSGDPRAFHHFSYDTFVSTFLQQLERTRATLASELKDALLDLELRHYLKEGERAFAGSDFGTALDLWENALKQNPMDSGTHTRIRRISEQGASHAIAADEVSRFYKLKKRPAITHDVLAGMRVEDMIFNKAQGTLLIAGFEKDAIYTFDPEGNYLGRHPGDYAAPIAMSVGPEGELWVCDFKRSRIVALDEDGRSLFDIDLQKLLPATVKGTRPLSVWADGQRVVAIVGNEALLERVGILFHPETPKESLRIFDDKQWQGGSSLFEMDGVPHMLNGFPGEVFALDEEGALTSMRIGKKLPLFPRKALSVGKDLFICGQTELLKTGHQGHSYKMAFETVTRSAHFLPKGLCMDDNSRLYLIGKRAGAIYVFDV